MNATETTVSFIASLATHASRFAIWADCINRLGLRAALEIGVWKGEFSEHILEHCQSIDRLYLIDPWRSLPQWNKPFNVDPAAFDAIYNDAVARMRPYENRVEILRGTTLEVIDQIPDESLDFIYIDGDHTLRGITIDMIKAYPKLKPGGILAGDDFSPTIWQHDAKYEPTLVCPFAAYFAESQSAPLVILPFNQFAVTKPLPGENGFRAIDTTAMYGQMDIGSQARPRL